MRDALIEQTCIDVLYAVWIFVGVVWLRSVLTFPTELIHIGWRHFSKLPVDEPLFIHYVNLAFSRFGLFDEGFIRNLLMASNFTFNKGFRDVVVEETTKGVFAQVLQRKRLPEFEQE